MAAVSFYKHTKQKTPMGHVSDLVICKLWVMFNDVHVRCYSYWDQAHSAKSISKLQFKHRPLDRQYPKVLCLNLSATCLPWLQSSCRSRWMTDSHKSKLWFIPSLKKWTKGTGDHAKILFLFVLFSVPLFVSLVRFNQEMLTVSTFYVVFDLHAKWLHLLKWSLRKGANILGEW